MIYISRLSALQSSCGSTIFSTLLDDQYGLNDILIGVCYIPNGIGTGLSALIAGRFMDTAYKKEKKRVGGDHRECPTEFRLEKTRFIFFPYQAGSVSTTVFVPILGLSPDADGVMKGDYRINSDLGVEHASQSQSRCSYHFQFLCRSRHQFLGDQ